MERRFLLRSLVITGISPELLNIPGTVNYDAEFEVEYRANKLDLKISVFTDKGWDEAKILACDEVKALALWLTEAAEHEKAGPHILKLD